MKNYFTIETISGSGLGDQLGTQFTRLYGLGKILGANYIYSPLSFSRSVKPSWYLRSEKVIFTIRYFLIFFIGQNYFANAVNVLLLKIEKKISKIQSHENDSSLNDFLGLKYLSDTVESFRNTVDVDLEYFFENTKEVSVQNFKNYIESEVNILDDNTLMRLSWSAKMWELIPKIDKVLYELSLGKESTVNKIFSDGFNKVHPNTNNYRKNIVLHIRCGDSTKISLGNRSLIVYDKFMFQSESEMKHILSIDPDRVSVPFDKFLDAYREITELIDKNNCDIFVISDGYSLTYNNILRNLLKRRCDFILTTEEKRQLRNNIRMKNDDFKQFVRATKIIGESKENLFDSILALAKADVVVWGSGGFACNVHNLFKEERKKSEVVNVNDIDQNLLNQI